MEALSEKAFCVEFTGAAHPVTGVVSYEVVYAPVLDGAVWAMLGYATAMLRTVKRAIVIEMLTASFLDNLMVTLQTPPSCEKRA
jgi:hypothetical protein